MSHHSRIMIAVLACIRDQYFRLPKLRELAIRYLACVLAMTLWMARLMAAQGTNAVHDIDLPTTLQLAGAQNLDVQIAREQLAEAKANHAAAVAQFFPWISPSFIYRQHDDKLQDSPGNIIDVHKYSYEPGATLAVRV